jgi:outer membrane protein OmpA-like peptidoglycan-associated protein
VESGKNFQLIGSKEYYIDGNTFATTVGNEAIVKADIILLKKPIEVQIKENPNLSEIMELNPIYFDLDKSNIRPDAKTELDKIVSIMNEYPDMVVEFSSYTDCRASAKYNQLLSERRASSTAKYIKKRITHPKRITGKGYGETMFSEACPCENNAITTCTDAEYQKERNSVFTIVKQ